MAYQAASVGGNASGGTTASGGVGLFGGVGNSGGPHQANGFDGRRARQNLNFERPTIDYNSIVIRTIQSRIFQTDEQDYLALQPNDEYMRDMCTASSHSMRATPSNAFCNYHMHTAFNREKYPVYTTKWQTDGRRVISGNQHGEFTLWNGLHFNFETIVQAHEIGTRAMEWSHDEQNMITGDDNGTIKYWNKTMSMIGCINDAHHGTSASVREISFSPTDTKFASCSDDHFVKIWDYNTAAQAAQAEQTLNLGNDVKSVAWHPYKGLLASGDKNSIISLWDPRDGTRLRTIYEHKAEVSVCRWNKNGNWLLTGGRDTTIKLWDIRHLKAPIKTCTGQGAAITSIAWHPHHEDLWVSGGMDGSLAYWLTDADDEPQLVFKAHDMAVWAADWHPVGHLLVTGSNDKSVKFWARSRPGGSDKQQEGNAADGDGASRLGGLSATRERSVSSAAQAAANALMASRQRAQQQQQQQQQQRQVPATTGGMRGTMQHNLSGPSGVGGPTSARGGLMGTLPPGVGAGMMQTAIPNDPSAAAAYAAAAAAASLTLDPSAGYSAVSAGTMSHQRNQRMMPTYGQHQQQQQQLYQQHNQQQRR